MLKGAIHIHSTYSDGEFALEELREVFVSAGCAFACVTDHAEFFDVEKLRAYVKECELLSDKRFCFVPGLEYSCRESMHVLGYGATRLVDTLEPEEVIQRIEAEGGIAVIAHPKDEAFAWIETFRALPSGIETWNSKYDGRYAPRPGTFRLLARLQGRKPEMSAFYGQDLHWKKQYRGLMTVARCAAPTRDALLAALASGEFSGRKGQLVLPSTGKLPEELLEKFAGLHHRSDRLKGWIKSAKKMTDRLGLAVPARLKSQLRRLF